MICKLIILSLGLVVVAETAILVLVLMMWHEPEPPNVDDLHG